MKILISNDDGYQAPGIVALHAALSRVAQVEVVAPEHNNSAKSNALTLHHTSAPPANGGWRIVEPVHWGPASGGDVLNVEGADFPMANMPHMRIGPVEARVMTYNSGYVSVRTPPAPFDLPGTFDVSSVWLVTATGNTQPAPVEARAPRSEWFTYVMDGPPEIVEIEQGNRQRIAVTV